MRPTDRLIHCKARWMIEHCRPTEIKSDVVCSTMQSHEAVARMRHQPQLHLPVDSTVRACSNSVVCTSEKLVAAPESSCAHLSELIQQKDDTCFMLR